jgi:hypothetical protein
LIAPDGTERAYELGAHRPNMTPEDVELTHRLWLDLSRDEGELHHNEIVSLALHRLSIDIGGTEREAVLGELRRRRES